jgi:putative nucleotidyltransferase with HDIG domain
MADILYIFRVVLKGGYYIGCMILFYVSLKKCFLREGRSKRKLLVLSILMSPVVMYVSAFQISGESWEKILKLLKVSDERSFMALFIGGLYFGLLYLALVLLCVELLGKWLKVDEKNSLLFLFLMFNTIISLATKGIRTEGLFSAEHQDLLDSAGTLVVVFATILFYCLVVTPLAKMKGMRVKVNWGIFMIPPAAFLILNSVFTIFAVYSKDMIGGALSVTIYLFSSIIVFLFIWAFAVIIKNMMATNEAVEAQNEAIKARDEVKTLSVEVMEALAHTIDAKDEYTRGHSVRVAKYSRMLAEKLGLSAEECENVYYMALLHDIGKIGVPNAIINSPTRLTDEEYAVIKTHPGVGFDILAEIKSRPDLSIGARWHHERYDGKGYPDRKAGEEIPYFARIIAVADTYDAMTSNRSYRKYMAQDAVRAEIEKNSGTQFDPKVAKCMLEIIDEDKNYELHE